MKRILTILTIMFYSAAGFAQMVTLTFTGRDANSRRVQLNRVVITNLTHSWQETIIWPDTTLTIGNGVGIVENGATDVFSLSQNKPNPFDGTTSTVLITTESGAVEMEITDINGRLLCAQNFAGLHPGIHQFHIAIANVGTYVLVTRQNGKTAFVKMVNNGNGTVNTIEYKGTEKGAFQLKNGVKGNTNKPFSFGDLIEYVGFANINGDEEESLRIMQQQDSSQTIALQFFGSMDGDPCPGMPTTTDIDNNIYNTVLIGTQCWMKENLRTKHFADNISISQGSGFSNDTSYWYYPNNYEGNELTHGLLYNWQAVMHNSTSSNSNPSDVQGICPDGWHVPSVAEWNQLTDYVGSQIPHMCSGNSNNIAKALAGTYGWANYLQYILGKECFPGYQQSDNNSTAFSALPAGFYHGNYFDFDYCANFWSATECGLRSAFFRSLHYDAAIVYCGFNDKSYAYSVRCIRD